MTATTKTYLQRLPAALGILIVTCILRHVLFNFIAGQALPWGMLFLYFVCAAGVLTALGYLSDKMRDALIAMGIQAAINISHFLLGRMIGKSELPANSEGIITLYSFIELLPWIFFISRQAADWKKQRPWIILAVFIIHRSLLQGYLNYPVLGEYPVTEWFFSSWSSRIIFDGMMAIAWLLSIILLTEVSNHVLQNKRPELRKLFVIPRQSWAGGLIAFCAGKTAIIIIAVGFTSIHNMLPVMALTNDNDWLYYLLRFNWLLTICCNLGLLIAAMIYVRAHILEYLTALGISQRIVYVLLATPLIGFVVWIALGFIRQPLPLIAQRKTTLIRFRNDSGTITYVSAMAIFGIIAYLMFSQKSGLLFPFAFVLAILASGSFNGYRLQLGLLACVIAYVVFHWLMRDNSQLVDVAYWGSSLEDFRLGLAAEVAAFMAGWTMLLLPAFHPKLFTADADGEFNQESSEDGHLFSEHEIA